MKIRFNHWLLRYVLRGTAGIVLYPYVLFKFPPEQVSDKLMRHEMQHVLQVRRTGWFKFYRRWLWWTLTEGYRRNPYEIEARVHEDFPMPADLQNEIDDAIFAYNLTRKH
jgi:hypothetical protein